MLMFIMEHFRHAVVQVVHV
uniref:Uncharacterized protein n=1 Tax=Anguilla anguilla TaxID=7936 RepID=A0A0E9SB01_ANGAN